MADKMDFPDTVEEFMEQYKVVDTDGVYMSKGSELVPIFRMRQWFEHLPSAQPEITNKEIRFALKQLGVYFAIKIRDGKEGSAPVELSQRVEEIQKYFENVPSAQPELIAQGAYVRGFEQGKTQGMVDAKLQPTCNKLATDCISRQAAIDAADRADYTGLAVEDVKKVTDEVVKELKQLPSAQPEQHGICRDCAMKNICRYKLGLGDYGYCSQWKGEEHG